MAQFKKLEPVRIFEQVVHQIRNLITTGEFKPGDRLPPEQELERQLSVSRSSIREALRVLEFEGLVEVRRGTGTFVTPHSYAKRSRHEITSWLEQREGVLVSLLQVREYIEGLTASLAATLANQEALDELDAVMNEIAAMNDKRSTTQEVDIERMAELDAHFHMVICKASENVIAIDIIKEIIPAFQESNKAVVYMAEKLDNLFKDHNAIRFAIRSRNPQLAEEAMRRHIARVGRDLENILHGSAVGKTEEQS